MSNSGSHGYGTSLALTANGWGFSLGPGRDMGDICYVEGRALWPKNRGK